MKRLNVLRKSALTFFRRALAAQAIVELLQHGRGDSAAFKSTFSRLSSHFLLTLLLTFSRTLFITL
jgi:hypothetical protein